MKSKKKLLTGLLLLIVVGAAIVGIVVFRNISQEPAVTVEQNTDIDTEAALAQVAQQTSETEMIDMLQGTFVDADAIHSGAGTAVITKTDDGPVLVFKEDFSVTSGPDLFVYLSPNASGEPLGEFVSLGKLQSNQGEQVYTLPENYQDYTSVVIWCRAFGTKFSYADLN